MKKLIVIFLFLPLLNIAQIQYTMPSEEDQHEGTWLQWPHNFTYPPWWQEDNEPAFIEMTRALESTEKVVQAYAGTEDPTDPILSPIYGKFNSSYPKTLITSGTRDFLLSSGTRLSRVMREAGVDVELRVWEGMWHVFEYYPQIPEAAASLEEMSSFLNSGF